MNVSSESQVLRVALDTPLRRLFDYLPPPALVAPAGLAAGMRVRVPFGRQRLIGVVMAKAASSQIAPGRLKPVLEVLDAEPVLDQSALDLLTWAADYYHHPIGEVVAGALPKALRLGAPARALEEHWVVSASGAASHALGEPRRAPRQRALLDLLVRAGGATAESLDGHSLGWRDAARALLAWLEARTG